MQIVKYQGNDKYIVGMAEKDEQKYIFFAKIDNIALKNTIEDYRDELTIKFTFSKKMIIEFLLKTSSDNSFMHLVEIKDVSEYETVCKFLEFIL